MDSIQIWKSLSVVLILYITVDNFVLRKIEVDHSGQEKIRSLLVESSKSSNQSSALVRKTTKRSKSSFETCTNILNHGKWQYQPNYHEIIKSGNSSIQNQIQKIKDSFYNTNLTDPQSINLGYNNLLKWNSIFGGRKLCDVNFYKTSQVKSCLKEYNSIQIIGDSRARQYFSALKSILQNNFLMFDSAWQMPASNYLEAQELSQDGSSPHPIKIHQAWVRHASQLPSFWSRRYTDHNYTTTESPKLFIITAMILHALTMSGREDQDEKLLKSMKNGTFFVETFSKVEKEFREIFFPFIVERAEVDGAIVILLSAEGIYPEIKMFDKERNFYIKKYNDLMVEEVRKYEKEKSNNPKKSKSKIFLMTVNRKISKCPTNDCYLLPDRFHLAKKDRPYAIPVTILSNLNILFNLACNRYLNSINELETTKSGLNVNDEVETLEDVCCYNLE